MNCGDGDNDFRPYLSCIRSATNSYAAYYKWGGNKFIRGYQMHVLRREWEMVAALYKHHRRRKIWKDVLDDINRKLHP